MTERTATLPPSTVLDGSAVELPEATGRLIERDGANWYRIDDLQRMEPFLTTVVSDSDLWLFASSAGPLTAGRVDPDHAMLPYETDDRLHRAVERSGPVTVLVRESDGQREVWQPFARRLDLDCTRAIEKHELGTALTLEEVNRAWGLRFRATWTPSRRFGWIRSVELTRLDGPDVEVEVLDGLLDVLPAGVDAVTQQLTSNLVDSYKRSETGPWGRIALYALESLITDRAEPAESLAATVIWSAGLDGAQVHLDERVVEDVRRGTVREPGELLTGRRGAYLLHASVVVPSGRSSTWFLALDTGLGHAALHDRVKLAADPAADELVDADVRAGVSRVEALLAGADGFQRTADPVADAHHLSNVLFNAMRGGVFPHGDRIPVTDLVDFLRRRNVEVATDHAEELIASGPWIALDALHDLAERSGDDDLVRLVLEYLPLTFSRRHGDPSRPWNRFSIKVTADDGAELLNYEGNWRDIFQNWEALLRSYPRFLPHVVAKFLNASTVDGHNPYRISRDGVDWEVPDPDEPWSNLGYWGDHQIVYLLRLLEGWERVDPAGLHTWLDRPLFTYADVPYRLARHAAMLANPRATVTYDEDRARQVAARVDRLGADGRLVEAGGRLVRVTMAEKLIVPALAKLSSYVAGGGIWMNTQRPEWNDANNALAGYGLSMVTLYHLERYLTFLGALIGARPSTPVVLSRQVAAWLADITTALASHDPEAATDDPVRRRELLDALGAAGETYRGDVTSGFDREVEEVDPSTVQQLLDVALTHLRVSIRAARRPDGLYHAYNLIAFGTADAAEVAHLPVMLEGQVAVLGTSELDAAQAASLVEALFDSALYRPDQRTFTLYPASSRPSFIDRNQIPADTLQDQPSLRALVGDPTRILEPDADGGNHFRSDLINAAALTRALDTADVDEEVRALVAEVYEEQFHHHTFTGRSGGMHGYEGIGSVYWHMVAKLLLAVQERVLSATDGADPTVVERLTAGYRRVRDGLGFRKGPAAFGAFPTDCYSHTPAHAGAQQPGMTGQVKEEVLTRLGELGFVLTDGIVRYHRPLLPADELWWTPDGERPQYHLTICGTPVRVVRGDDEQVRIERVDGTVTERAGHALTAEESADLFDRRGAITAVEIQTVQEGDQ